MKKYLGALFAVAATSIVGYIAYRQLVNSLDEINWDEVNNNEYFGFFNYQTDCESATRDDGM